MKVRAPQNAVVQGLESFFFFFNWQNSNLGFLQGIQSLLNYLTLLL